MLNKILEDCNFVIENAKYVKINDNKIDELVKNADNIESAHWLSSSPFGLLDLSVKKIINFLLIFEAIDFSFWGNPKWTIETRFGSLDGSIALLYAILEYVKNTESADFSKVSKEEFSNILKGNIQIPLFNERYKIIKNISIIVNKEMNGNFYQFIKNINNDKELFKIINKYFPYFKDERIYNGRKIHFYKLAQLLVSDILHIRRLKENVIVDYSNLVGCSDYKIPQVLRALDIIEYNEELSALIDNKKEIEMNSEYEVEIRASMIVVINKIKEKMNGNAVAIDINDYLFGQAKNKMIELKPYHLTRTINY